MGIGYRINGKEVTREEFLADAKGIEPGAPAGGQSAAGWPMYSDAAGCHPGQIAEFKQFFAGHGVSAEYTRDGRLKFDSPGDRRRKCELLGLYDRNGGYGDPRKRR